MQSIPRRLYNKYSNRIEKELYKKGLLAAQDLCLPDFMVIGSPQSGTTWLFQNLIYHPQLYLPPNKQIHYFDRHFDMRLKSYANFFLPGEDKVKGEITPDYGILEQERIKFIHSIMPCVKLILMARNPIDRTWSAARRIFTKQSDRFWEEIDENEIYDFFLNQKYSYPGDYEPGLNYGDYSRIIKKWLSEFPREQLFIGFFDDISCEPKALLTNIFEFLGVSSDISWDDFPFNTVFNKNPNVELPRKYRDFLEDLYCEELERLYDQFGGKVANWRC